VSAIGELSGDIGSERAKEIPTDLTAPLAQVSSERFYSEAMKCANLLGILWSGRDHAKRSPLSPLTLPSSLLDRSFLFLLASKQIYDTAQTLGVAMKADKRAEMESALTHTLFYLAQAYGNNGDAQRSSLYCQQVRRINPAALDSPLTLFFTRLCNDNSMPA
jgi:hypothetical protein